MKYGVIILIFLFCFSVQNIFGALDMNLEAPKTAKIGEVFYVDAKLSLENNLEITDIELQGTKNLQQVSSQQRQQLQSINGQTKSTLILKVGLIGTKEGKYDIGPLRVRTNSGSFETNTVSVELTSGNLNSLLQLPGTPSSENLPYDIYPLRSETWGLAPYTLLFFFGILIFVFLFLALKKYLFESDQKELHSSAAPKLTREEIYIQRFRDIPLSQDKTEFYKQFHSLLRAYLKESGIENIETMTYFDTKNNKVWKGKYAKYERIFKETYFDEFTPFGQENIEKKKESIETICSLLLNT